MAERTKPTRKKTSEGEVIKTRTEENLDVLVGQLENALPQQFSDKHIDRYFDGQEKLFEYIRDDHKDQKDLVEHGRKYVLYYMVAGGVVLLAFMIIIALSNKALLGKFLELFFAFIGGTGVGSLITSKLKRDE